MKYDSFTECSKQKPLTKIRKNNSNVYLVIDALQLKSFYNDRKEIDCCWQEIIRFSSIQDQADDHYKYFFFVHLFDFNLNIII